jgi:hypothetical protein
MIGRLARALAPLVALALPGETGRDDINAQHQSRSTPQGNLMTTITNRTCEYRTNPLWVISRITQHG